METKKGNTPLRELNREGKDRTIAWLWSWMGAWFGADVWARNAPDNVKGTWEVVLRDCTGADFARGLRATREAEDKYPIAAGKFLARCRAQPEGIVPQVDDPPMSKEAAAAAFDNLFTAKATSSALARKHIAACRRVLDGEKLPGAEREELGLMTLDVLARDSNAAHYRMMKSHSLHIGHPDAWQRHVPGCCCRRCEVSQGYQP